MRWTPLLLTALAACASPTPGPYTPPAATDRDTHRAETLNRQAADLLTTDPARAESLLREALTADLFHGPSHNNLGVLFLERGDLYEAANEFEWARQLMPSQPDPRLNLALVYEAAGRTSDARTAYEGVLATHPDHIAALQGLALLTVREGSDDAQLPDWLDRIALGGEDDTWKSWAKGQMARRVSDPGLR